MNNPALYDTAVIEVSMKGQYVFNKLILSFPFSKGIKPSNVKSFRLRYIGIKIVVGGTRIVKMTQANRKLLPINFNLAKPYPAKAHEIAVNNVVNPAK